MDNKNFSYSFSDRNNRKSHRQKKYKGLVQAVFVFLFFLLGFSAVGIAQTTPAKIHANDITNSDDFKRLQGSDRLVVFQKLENLIKPSSSFDGPAPDYEYFIGDYKMNSAELVILLGEPDVKIAPSIWQYYLSTDQRCKVLIGIDSDAMVSYVVLKDCL